MFMLRSFNFSTFCTYNVMSMWMCIVGSTNYTRENVNQSLWQSLARYGCRVTPSPCCFTELPVRLNADPVLLYPPLSRTCSRTTCTQTRLDQNRPWRRRSGSRAVTGSRSSSRWRTATFRPKAGSSRSRGTSWTPKTRARTRRTQVPPARPCHPPPTSWVSSDWSDSKIWSSYLEQR